MSSGGWANIYNLTDEQINQLDDAEKKMEMHDLTGAEEVLLQCFQKTEIASPC